MKKLTSKRRLFLQKQRLFVHEYLIDLNGTKAAIRTGYSAKAAKVTACKLMKLPAVKKAIEAALAKKTNNLIMTREEILQELSIVGRFDLADYQVHEEGGTIRVKTFEEMPEGASRALKSVQETRTIAESKDGKETNLVSDWIKIEGQDKLRALELLGKHEGLFPTRLEGSVEIKAQFSMKSLKKSLKETVVDEEKKEE